MPLTPAVIKRAIDASGDDIRTFQDGAVEVPGHALVGDGGEHIGITGAPVIVAPGALTKSSTGGALEATHNAKNAAGVFFRVRMVIDGPSIGGAGTAYLHVFDLAAPPGGGETPVLRYGLPVDNPATTLGGVLNGEIEVPEGLAMASGIQVGISSTLATFTSGGAIATFDVFFL